MLPNDRDAVLAAGQAAVLTPLVEVAVIPTRNAAEGIAAAVAFDPTAPLAANVERMAAESAALRSFTVVTAARDSVVDGQPVRQGQMIALDAARHLLAVGADVESVTLQALAQYEDFELVTIYCGDSEGGPAGARRCASTSSWPAGQPRSRSSRAANHTTTSSWRSNSGWRGPGGTRPRSPVGSRRPSVPPGCPGASVLRRHGRRMGIGTVA